MRTASFHARRLGRTRANYSYAGVGEKDRTYVVTADANVYYQKSEIFGSGYEYIWQYSAATKTEANWFESNIFPDIDDWFEGGVATTIRNNIVASYDILADAKAYADTLYASTQAGTGTTSGGTTTTPAAGTTTVTTPGGTTTNVPSSISVTPAGTGTGTGTGTPAAATGLPTWVWPMVAVVAIGGVTAVVIGAAGKKDKKKAAEEEQEEAK